MAILLAADVADTDGTVTCMALDRIALSSLAATLEDLVSRLGTLAAEADDDEEGALELLEVERQLLTASRRLTKATRFR